MSGLALFQVGIVMKLFLDLSTGCSIESSGNDHILNETAGFTGSHGFTMLKDNKTEENDHGIKTEGEEINDNHNDIVICVCLYKVNDDHVNEDHHNDGGEENRKTNDNQDGNGQNVGNNDNNVNNHHANDNDSLKEGKNVNLDKICICHHDDNGNDDSDNDEGGETLGENIDINEDTDDDNNNVNNNDENEDNDND